MSDQDAVISNNNDSQRKKPQYSEGQRKKHYQDYRASQFNKISQSALRKWIKKFEPKEFFTNVNPSPLLNRLNKQSFEIIFSTGIRLRFPELIDLEIIKQLIQEMRACN